jgi:Rps23 Pro-64 3,4-dihydroxylase Tpa1-like proline 4-hydroxylase
MLPQTAVEPDHSVPPMPVCHAVWEEFLVWPELAALRTYVSARVHDFAASRVVGDADPIYRDYRRSRILLDLDRFETIIAERLERYLDHALSEIEHKPFPIARVEAQITASNQGDYFRRHSDNTDGCPSSREITFVYFFHREPARFTGGELLLHRPYGCGVATSITPRANAVVLFASSTIHEVLPVRCPSGQFSDSRLTVNGWIHR